MTEEYLDRIEKLQEEWSRLSDGPTKMALVEEAVGIADTHNDIDLGFKLRKTLIKTGTFGGFPEKALVAFSWQLAQCDRDPETFDEEDLLWEYKWIANSLYKFPQITREQIQETLADMRTRYERSDLSLKPIWKEWTNTSRGCGDVQQAKDYYYKWYHTVQDYGNDCRACDRNFRVNQHVFLGEYERALKVAGPLLEGRDGCGQVPHVTYSEMLLPLLHLGEIGYAAECHKKGYPMIADSRNYVEELGDHLTYLVVVQDLDKATTLFEKHIAWAVEMARPFDPFFFYVASTFLFKQLLQAGTEKLLLRVPKNMPFYNPEGEYKVQELLGWCEGQASELARRFDARNGNDYMSKQLQLPDTQWQELIDQIATEVDSEKATGTSFPER